MKNHKENKQLQVGKLCKAKLHFFENGNAITNTIKKGKWTYFLLLKIYPYKAKDYCYSFEILAGRRIFTLIAFSTETIKEVV